MRRPVIVVVAAAVAAALLLLATLPASAAPYTPHFKALQSELKARDAALDGDLDREQAKAKRRIGRAMNILSRRSTSLTGDLGIAASLSRLLDVAFPGDPIVEGLLDDLADDLAGEAFDASDALFDAVLQVDDERLIAKGERALDAADLQFERAFGAETRVARLRFVGRAFRRVFKGARAILKAFPGTAVVGGTYRGTWEYDGASFDCPDLYSGSATLVVTQVALTVKGNLSLGGIKIRHFDTCSVLRTVNGTFPFEGTMDGTSLCGFVEIDVGGESGNEEYVYDYVEITLEVDGTDLAGDLFGNGDGTLALHR